jgi:hypothetical protein
MRKIQILSLGVLLATAAFGADSDDFYQCVDNGSRVDFSFFRKVSNGMASYVNFLSGSNLSVARNGLSVVGAGISTPGNKASSFHFIILRSGEWQLMTGINVTPLPNNWTADVIDFKGTKSGTITRKDANTLVLSSGEVERVELTSSSSDVTPPSDFRWNTSIRIKTYAADGTTSGARFDAQGAKYPTGALRPTLVTENRTFRVTLPPGPFQGTVPAYVVKDQDCQAPRAIDAGQF